jgi:amino acid adenylation domain-containing protein
VTDTGDVFAFPASFAQRRLWYLDQIESGTAVYNIPQAFRLRGPLDEAVLRKSLRTIVERHESLRTTFESEEGSPLQVVTEQSPFDLEVVSLEGHDDAWAEGERRAAEQARTGFDLEAGPLVRATLYRIADSEHVLFLNVHHIICDGWSLALLFAELTKLYASFKAGASSPLPEQEIQYADYAIWQQEAFTEGDMLEGELAFWKDYLGGELPQLSLPFDHHRPQEPSLEGKLRRFNLTGEETEAVRALAKTEKTSLFMTLLSAFSAFLSRITGETDILVGSPIANRDRDEIREAIGFYTNTVVFRNDLGGGPTFRELLARARVRVLGVLAHQEVPLEAVIEAVNPDRTLGDNPVFQVMFAHQVAPESALSLPGVELSAIDVHSATSKFDLLLEMQELSEGMQCFFEYATDLFDDSTAERLVTHFVVFLRELVADPDRPVAEVPMMTAEQRRELLAADNATQAPVPSQLLHEIVAACAGEHPDAVALEVEGETLSYAQLDARSNQLAHHLQAIGVGPDVMVGVCAERGFDMLVGMLGAMKAGAAYLPLDPLFPPDRIAYMIEDSAAPVLLTQAELSHAIPAGDAKVVRLDADWDTIASQPTDAPETAGTTGESLAYMIYTSGSTGKPKGVQIPHRAVVNFLATMAQTPGMGRDDKLLAVTTLSFDISVLELFLPLTVGATVCIATHEQAVDGHDLLEAIRERGVSMMQATPATWRLMIEAGWEADSATSLKKVLCGGEAWPAGLGRELVDRADEVWNMYGPTETTIWSTCARVTDGDHVVIGKPIANTTLFIVDKNQQLVPPGVAGELLIGGEGLARGYHQRPELSAERFVDNPFGDGKVYRTGDLVKRLPDGSVRYLNRLDNQVKVRGYRIELGEIESALEKHEDVKQPVVIVWDAGGGDKRLAAYIVYEAGKTLTGSELRRFLRDSLPDYMIPHLFVEMGSLPLTANNKVNRRALPDPLKQGQADASAFKAPETDAEKLVAKVWKDVLGLDREVSMYDNFFDLGGHSLLSAQVTFKLEKQTGIRLSPRSMVFQNLTQLAAELSASNDQAELTDVAKPGADPPMAVPAADQPVAAKPTAVTGPAKAAAPPAREPPKEEAPKGVGGWLLNKVKKRLLR